MMSYFKPLLAVSLVTFALGACDSKQENQREDALEQKADTVEERADAVRDRGEQVADQIESQDPGLMNEPRTERAADNIREATEERADELEEQADAIRDKK